MKKIILAILIVCLSVIVVIPVKTNAKGKYTYYRSTLDVPEYVYMYDSYKKDRWGMLYRAQIKGNYIKLTGSLSKSKVKSPNKKQTKFLEEKTRTFKLSNKVKFYRLGGDESIKYLSKGEFSRLLQKGTKGMLCFGVNLKVKKRKVVQAWLDS